MSRHQELRALQQKLGCVNRAIAELERMAELLSRQSGHGMRPCRIIAIDSRIAAARAKAPKHPPSPLERRVVTFPIVPDGDATAKEG